MNNTKAKKAHAQDQKTKEWQAIVDKELAQAKSTKGIVFLDEATFAQQRESFISGSDQG